MITVLSPAKTLDYDTTPSTEASSSPRFEEERHQLISKLRTLEPNDIKLLMGISDELADLNYTRYRDFDVAPTRQAILTFNGHVYRDIDWPNYQKRDFDFAQQHLRILSGLYGLLRPLDMIKPYRLEMGTKLKTSKGSNLYDFWGKKIARLCLDDLEKQNDSVVVNLASNEYSKALINPTLDADIIEPVFKDWHEKSATYKIISVYAKIARGTMTNWIILNKINSLEELENFAEDGYTLNSKKESLRSVADNDQKRRIITLTFHRRT